MRPAWRGSRPATTASDYGPVTTYSGAAAETLRRSPRARRARDVGRPPETRRPAEPGPDDADLDESNRRVEGSRVRVRRHLDPRDPVVCCLLENGSDQPSGDALA